MKLPIMVVLLSWELSSCQNMQDAELPNQIQIQSREYITISNSTFDGPNTKRISFDVKNTTMESICVKEAALSDQPAYLLELFIKNRFGKLVNKYSTSGIPVPVSKKSMIIAPNETISTMMNVSINFENIDEMDFPVRVMLRIAGVFCTSEEEIFVLPDFWIVSDWYTINS